MSTGNTKSWRSLWPLFGLFFCSGASTLVFEVIWQREMILVFGASAPAITAILSAFFLGIALGSEGGSKIFARLQTRLPALRIYSLVELWIGVWGLSVPFLLRGIDHVFVEMFAAHTFGPTTGLLLRFLMAMVVVLPATLGMGATVPVMSHLIHEHGRGIGRSVSLAYGFNTIGAVVGCLLAGFVLIKDLGMQHSLYCASALNLFVVLSSWLWSLRQAADQRASADVPTKRGKLTGERRGLVAVYFIASFLTLAFEVAWMRSLAILNSNTITTFTVGLAVYLTGFSLGSLVLYAFLERRWSGVKILAFSSAGIGVVSLVALPFAQSLTNSLAQSLHAAADSQQSFTLAVVLIETGKSIYLMFIPALFMGLGFPATCQAITERDTPIAPYSGFIYFVGNIGAMLGAFFTGLFIIPALGIANTLGTLTAVSLWLAVVTLQFGGVSPRRRVAQAISVALGGVAIYLGAHTAPFVREGRLIWDGEHWRYMNEDGHVESEVIIRYSAGPSGTVSVKEVTDTATKQLRRRIYVDDQAVASTFLDAQIDSKMLAHIPFLLHPHPQTALTVGFGSGGTSWSMTLHGVQTDVVEIEPEVIRSAGLFENYNHNVLQSPALRVVLNDARNLLHVAPKKYDVISTDVTNLEYKQNSTLYTREYFELMKARLNDGGIACAWIPMGGFSDIDSDQSLAVLLRTWQAVFPNASLWVMDQAATRFGILIGTPGPLKIDAARLKEGFANSRVREDLAAIGIVHPFQIAHYVYLMGDSYRHYTGEGPLHTDDLPVLEFTEVAGFHAAGEKQYRRLSQLWSAKPESMRSVMVNLSPADEIEFAQWEKFSRVWGKFVWDELTTAPPMSRAREKEYLEQNITRIQEALRIVPDYPLATRKLEEYRQRARRL